MKLKIYHLVIIMVSVVLGLMLALQFRYADGINDLLYPDSRAADLVLRVSQMRKEQTTLQDEVDKLRMELDEATDKPQLQKMKNELDEARIEAGITDVTGPGVQVTMSDSTVPITPGENPNLYVLHDEDVLHVLNELKAAGAEAISINGHRILAGTEIRCIGPAILVNKSGRITPPYVISAIGNPETLTNALEMRGGVVDFLQFWGIQINIHKMNQITVPAYSNSISFEYAHPVTAAH